MEERKKIHAEVYFTPAQIDEMMLKDKNVVVIDVLRASTTVITALHHGAKEVIPVNTIESVVKISSSLFGDVTLRAGERNGKMIEGFNLGNSPLEYTEDVVKGKSIILLTTNGSSAMVKGRYAKNLAVAGFANLSTVVSFLHEMNSDFIIICSGKENRFCIEDAVCAGRILNALTEKHNSDLATDDTAEAAMVLDKNVGRNILKMLRSSGHGTYLSQIGFADDLKACAATDTMAILPLLSNNIIRASNNMAKRPSPLR
ncbi:MAG TPA: 2-phosphosulfolactate phosphatase [Bacteroidota bacterium]|nr:2-phosphosulfolactate phosphatase [Bacteroidota bacterium]